MALRQYKSKRSFGNTPEPVGGKPAGENLHFVIQKHDASHLHYDFRLEMGGVLKSWAVPKGPSSDPSVRRLAMMVEDHPYGYKDFEGIIPEGNYGAGTVMVWDQGSYNPIDGTEGKKAQEKSLLKQLKEGSLKVMLHGTKLKGEYALVRTKGMGENAWLLIKHKDRYAKAADVTRKDKSVVSGKTLAGIARTHTRAHGTRPPVKAVSAKAAGTRPEKTSAPKKAAARSTKKAATKKPPKAVRAHPDNKVAELIATAPKAKFPLNMAPMLATLVDKPSEEAGWIHELKWDGYRALAFLGKGDPALKSRNNKSFNDKFYPVFDALRNWHVSAVVDGEIVVVNDKGVSDFGALQNWRSEADGTLRYYVFDLPWYEGRNLMSLPLTDRRAVLAAVIPTGQQMIQFSADFQVPADEFLKAARQLGMEGIMVKRAESVYQPAERSRDWLKIKAARRQEVVIGGYTRNTGTTKPFSSLLVGVFEKGYFVYTGKIGTGFSHRTQEEMLKRFRPLEVKKSPFTVPPDVNKASRFRPDPPHASAVWLKPKLVCEVSYTELTRDGVMRHPSFKGMREDKDASEVILEKEIKADDMIPKQKKRPVAGATTGKKSGQPKAEQTFTRPPKKGATGTLVNPSEETQVRKVTGHEMKFTHLSKVYWPGEHITKRDMINYYYQIAEVMLPYLVNRPQSLNRFPNGIKGKHFYQKDVTGKVPDWIKTFLYHTEDDAEDKHFLVADGVASLLYMASMGCIEINPWSSTIKKPDHPTWCIIDLDPGKKTTFDEVIEAAGVTHAVLEEMKVPSYAKTSGSTGMHIYIPMGGKYTYEQSKEFARVVVTLVQERIPAFTTLERSVSGRRGKMYLDFLQNRPQATIAAPYSLRPKPGATVSMPLDWEEVKPGLAMEDFNIFNAVERVRSRGDIFKPVLGKGINLPKVIRDVQKLLS